VPYETKVGTHIVLGVFHLKMCPMMQTIIQNGSNGHLCRLVLISAKNQIKIIESLFEMEPNLAKLVLV